MLTQARLKELLDYNPETGIFKWRIKPAKRIMAGATAGGLNHYGYIEIRIDQRLHRAHRLAWLYMTGEWPNEAIDHIDGQKSNNAFTNLRQATRSQNYYNVGIRKTNTSGVKGVSWVKARNKWRGQVVKNHRVYSTGNVNTLEEAVSLVRRLRSQLHEEFSNHG